MKVVFIGAGNLATNLAKALHEVGEVQLVQVYSRTETSATALATAIGAPSAITSLEAMDRTADLYIIALKDVALVELLPQLVAHGNPDALWVHTAGSIGMNIFADVAQRYGVFYPMQTFSKQRTVSFAEIPLFVEAASAADTQLLYDLAATLSTKVYRATSEQRKSLHLAAVFTCNFTNHMYALAERLLEKYDLPFEVMLPLIDETAKKVHQLSPREAQTGPAVRNDRNVMAAHEEMLADEADMQQLYRMISENIQQNQKKNNT